MTERPKILIVEDEPLILMDLVDSVEEAGFKTFEASSGEEAFEILDRCSDQLDLLITDINLGVGLNGWDVAEKSRGLARGLPIIFVTGDSLCDWKERPFANSRIFVKPIAPSKLLQAANNMMK